MRRDLDERLNDLIDGRLPADEARAFNTRLAQEPELRERHDELRRMGSLLRAADPARGVDVPAGFASQVRARIAGTASLAAPIPGGPVDADAAVGSAQANPSAERPTGRMFRFFAVAYAAAAVLVLGVTLVVTLRDDPDAAAPAVADRLTDDGQSNAESAGASADRALGAPDKKTGAFHSESAPSGARGGGSRAQPQGQPSLDDKSPADKPGGATVGGRPRTPPLGNKEETTPKRVGFGPYGLVPPGMRKAKDDPAPEPKGAVGREPADARGADGGERPAAGGKPSRGPPAAPIVPEQDGADKDSADGAPAERRLRARDHEEQELITPQTFVLTTADVQAAVRSLKQHLQPLDSLMARSRRGSARPPQPEPGSAPARPEKSKKSEQPTKSTGRASGSAGAFERLERELARTDARFAQGPATPAARGRSKHKAVAVEVLVTPAQLARLLALTRVGRSSRWAKEDADDPKAHPAAAPGTAGPATPRTPSAAKQPSSPAPAAPAGPGAAPTGGKQPAEKRIRIRILVQAR